ncbi:MAG: transaldolase family protein [Candidatus Sumerlaeia bacterium]|nr:transaldolase family protein [Candidatus Sumerlaeia bacterium]
MFTADNNPAAVLMRRRGMDAVNPTPAGKSLRHPAERAPRIFADTADLDAIKTLYAAGIINGVTTNPTLMKRAGAKSWGEAKEMMREICRVLAPNPVSLELTKLTYDEMVAQAEELRALGENSVIKVPTGGYAKVDKSLDPFTGLKVLRALWERDIRTNATLIFSTQQAYWCAQAGASYVSPFLGRLADYLYKNDQPERAPGNSLHFVEDHKNAKGDQAVANTEYVACGGARKDAGIRLIREIVQVFSNYDIQTEILAASFRNLSQVPEALQAGADILTVPSELLMQVADHPLSDAGMVAFVEDSKVFGG